MSELDWTKAETYLREARTAYAEIGTAGTFALTMVLMPLTSRYEKGERTQELYDEIFAVKL